VGARRLTIHPSLQIASEQLYSSLQLGVADLTTLVEDSRLTITFRLKDGLEKRRHRLSVLKETAAVAALLLVTRRPLRLSGEADLQKMALAPLSDFAREIISVCGKISRVYIPREFLRGWNPERFEHEPLPASQSPKKRPVRDLLIVAIVLV